MEIAFGVLGGLGLFLYGMHIMSTGLQKVAGQKLKSIISALTSNRFTGVMVGALVTAIVQSSSATTVMVVGFVNAGMMQLGQAASVIMGANVGTTITAQIITFKIDRFAPLIIGVAVGIWLFSKNRKTKQLAEAFIGFGMLFIGMKFMSDALGPLREFEGFRTLLISFGENPVLGILAGFAITIMVQSSTASTGILLALSMEGLIPIESGLPILFGINLGTTVTAIISSIGANKTAKRAASFHLLFNLIGTIIFIFLLQGPTYHLIKHLSPDNIPRQIANAHTIFNITTTLLMLPFTGVLIKLAYRMVPGETDAVVGVKYIDERILNTPSIALATAIKETLHMGNTAKKSLEEAMGSIIDGSEKKINESLATEKVTNELEREIASYLVKLSNRDLSPDQRETVDGLFHTINDIERVGDHAENIAELSQFKIDNKLTFSEVAINEIKEISDLTIEAYEKALTAMKTLDINMIEEVLAIEKQVDKLEKTLRVNHISRLNAHQCVPSAGVIFLDMINNLERISDHAANIALATRDEIVARRL
ncbi:Na/Pi cotransporter family protein [Tindallia californiensis]|uniref:Phosphate:Na+ symporter n=1 Tax=Tindallia californiensis TaxID=159292 RepID=A0A1H3ICR8_9FIRM|nr:Na/Pi cotransporter family protein [Tindallia californiensis]SDY25530.1 phosphate:Na+ symporter [Tindallia californiensis]